MAGRGREWMVGLAVLAGLLGSDRTVTAETREPLRIGLLLIDQADVEPAVLARARDEAARIYSGLGITLVWTGADGVQVDYRFTVKIIAKAIVGKGVDGRAMGVAPGTRETRGTLAYAFYGRIKDVTRTIGADTGLILGHVIAHEIGHLLLPYDSHATSGLMQGGWDQEQARRAEMGWLTFTPDEAALIWGRQETVSGTAARR